MSILSNGHYSYFDKATNEIKLNESIRWCLFEIAESGLEFDAIVATGVSGLVVAPIVAYLLNKPCVIVRKCDDESTHSDNYVEGCLPETYLIIDDFTDTGNTVERVQEVMRDHAVSCGYSEDATKCVGLALYQARALECW